MSDSALRRAAKAFRDRLHRSIRERTVRKEAPPVTKEQIKKDLRKLGIGPGDVVFLHSSLKSLGYVVGGPRAVLDALYETITPDGTLIIPTFHMIGGTILNTCRAGDDYVFDPRAHGTVLGSLPSEFLSYPGVKRSIHPTHSVSAVGKYGERVTVNHHKSPSIFGEGSPWERFLELDGKLLGLGVSMGPITFYHLLEDLEAERFPLPVHSKETYRLKCRLPEGDIVEVPVTPLKTEFMKQRIDTPERDDLRAYFRKEFQRAGLLMEGRVGEADAWFVSARSFYDHLKYLMDEGITIYSDAKALERRPVDV